jgi:hypothetical protein
MGHPKKCAEKSLARMAQITKELASKICRKLDAQLLKDGAHQRGGVFHKEVLIGTIGIRHGSNKDQSHDHIPKELNLSPHFTRELGICTKSRDEYLNVLREKKLLPAETTEPSPI